MPDIQKAEEIALIDVDLVALETYGANPVAYGITTATQIQVATETEVTEAIKLIIKDVLKAQKKKRTTVTGTTITMTNNMFTPEVAILASGGTATYDENGKLTSFEPPTPSSTEAERGTDCKVIVFSSQYDTSGERITYWKLTFPHCKGEPFTIGAQDGVFNVDTYTFNSAPASTEPPYKLEKVAELPELVEKPLPARIAAQSSNNSLTVTVNYFNALPATKPTIGMEFTYDGSVWKLNGATVTLSNYGVTVTGTPDEDDTITIVADE